ncbi:unnamed protein product [Cyclocybe aegerita]|uniref:Ras GEF n=1 Tax=Cyclocybe aegerita TaxID=1973307 RepID=A0A8S0XTW2_CYCAE|nr:unnamed protein product [Cyclocybe aegerita]
MSGSLELPDLPPLASLDMLHHDSPSTPSPNKLPVPTNRDSATFLKSPAPSFAESFNTAFTSQVEDSDDTTRLVHYSLAPPQNLRKSISVDSFAQYGRDGSRSIRGYPNSPSEQPQAPLHATQAESQVRPDRQPWVGRNRGESLSSVHRDHGPSPLDSDVDRYDPLNLPALERFRRASLKNQDTSKPSIRGGDLPLPARSHNLSVTPSLATNSTTSSPTISNSPSTSAFPPSARRITGYSAANPGRTRSGSLGYNPPNSSKRMVINPHVSIPRRSSVTSSDIVLVVIGTTGCGKSTVIRKGLSGYGLSDSLIISDAAGSIALPRYIRRRTGPVKLDHPESPGAVPQVIEVIEVEVQTTTKGLLWPQGLPPIDGIIICYDSSKKSSYQPVEGLLKGYRSTTLPIMVLGCKADLDHEVDPADALEMLKQYDTGLIEVSTNTDGGKDKMRRCFDFLLKAVLRQRGPSRTIDDRNPASPDLPSKGAPWERSMTNTPTASPSIPTNTSASSLVNNSIPESSPSTSTRHAIPTPPSGEPPAVIEMSHSREDIHESAAVDSEDQQHQDSETSPGLPDPKTQQALADKKNAPRKEPRPTQWTSLEELLDKLLFLAVSGDDPTFTSHFLLTYRRFATPRSVLLAMQKRMRQLDNPCGDPMFACFAQMRICHLLETWIRDYSHDFAVKGTVGALNALIKSIISKTHLLHYGSEFLPFLEQLPTLVDQDTTWSLKADISDNDSDDYNEEDDDDEARIEEPTSLTHDDISPPTASTVSFPSRERKSSLPLPKALLSPSQVNGALSNTLEPKHQIKELTKLASDILTIDSQDIAQEITRQGVKKFLAIKPRDWLHYTFVFSKKNDNEPISAFNTMANHLADWVVSLILCHHRPRNRARQIEKLVDIAQKLRQMNNYSALRAFVAGINNATDDPTMEQLKSRSPDAAKNLMSWDVLLQQIRSHRAYRLALRNSKGACIPALEVHMSDLIRAHEGNGEVNESDPTKIHWGKFNMMGRFITSTLQCQAQCRNSNDYDFPDRSDIAELFVKCPVMTTEMQKSRLSSQNDYDDYPPVNHPVGQPKTDLTGLRKLFFW